MRTYSGEIRLNDKLVMYLSIDNIDEWNNSNTKKAYEIIEQLHNKYNDTSRSYKIEVDYSKGTVTRLLKLNNELDIQMIIAGIYCKNKNEAIAILDDIKEFITNLNVTIMNEITYEREYRPDLYKSIKVKYKNWQGKVGVRTIIPEKLWYGSTNYHKEDQWLLDVWDCDKEELRTYAMQDIIEFIKDGE